MLAFQVGYLLIKRNSTEKVKYNINRCSPLAMSVNNFVYFINFNVQCSTAHCTCLRCILSCSLNSIEKQSTYKAAGNGCILRGCCVKMQTTLKALPAGRLFSHWNCSQKGLLQTGTCCKAADSPACCTLLKVKRNLPFRNPAMNAITVDCLHS